MRKLMGCAAAVLLMLGTPSVAPAAESFPQKTIRFIVPFPPGGPTDILARIVGQHVGDQFGQPVVIENRPGAGGNIGTQFVATSPPDGYTLLIVTHANAINATLYQKLSFDFLKDIAPVSGLARVPNVLEVHPSLPVRSVGDLIDYARQRPGELHYASAGNGTSAHLAAELFKSMTGTKMIHVPYRGSGPALVDLLGGQVQLMFDSLPSSIEHIRGGKLRALAMTTAARTAPLADLPTVAEQVPGYEASGWFGVGAPAGTPAPIVAALNAAIQKALRDADIAARMNDLGASPMPGDAAAFGALLADETAKWAVVVRATGAALD